MPFRFALAPLLRLRQGIVRQRTLALQEASLQLTRAQGILEEFDRSITESACADESALAIGRTAADLQFASLLRDKLKLRRVELQDEIHRLEKVRRQAVHLHQQAYLERESLEGLRVHQRRIYQVEQSRRQQQDLDATHLLQRWHHRDG